MQTTHLDSLFTMETRSYLCLVSMDTYLVELDATDLKLVLPQFNCFFIPSRNYLFKTCNAVLMTLPVYFSPTWQC